MVNSSSSVLAVPEEYLCPLTMELMERPLMSRHGHNFEQEAILRWLEEGNGTCPLTRKPMGVRDLVSNFYLQKRIDEWKIQNAAAATATTIARKSILEEKQEHLCMLMRNAYVDIPETMRNRFQAKKIAVAL